MKKTVLLLSAVLILCMCIIGNAMDDGWIYNEGFERGIQGFGISRSSSDYNMPSIFLSDYIAKSGSSSLEVFISETIGKEATKSLSSMGFAYQGLMCQNGYTVEEGRSYWAEAWLYTEEQDVCARILEMDGARAMSASNEFILEPYKWNRICYLWDCDKSSTKNSIRIAFYNVSANTSVYVDDVTYIPNYVDNGGFELGTKGWSIDDGAKVYEETDSPIKGNVSLKLIAEDDSRAGISQRISADRFKNDGKYIVSANVYTESEGVYILLSAENIAQASAEFELEKGIQNYVELIIDSKQCTGSDFTLGFDFQNLSGDDACVYIDDIKIRDENSIISAVRNDNGEIELSGILKDGNESADITVNITDYASGKVLDTKSIRTDEFGNYAVLIDIGETEDAKTELFIELSGIVNYEEFGNKLYSRYNYINKEKVEEYVKAIANASTHNELSAILEKKTAVKSLEFDKIDIFRSNTDKQGLYNYLLAAERKVDYDSIRNEIIRGCAICSINNSPDTLNSVIGRYADVLGISDLRAYKEYYKFFDFDLLKKMITNYNENKNNAGSISDMQKGFETAVLKTVIREQTYYSNVINILKSYASELGIDFTNYNELTNDYDVAVNFAKYAQETKDLTSLNAKLAQLIGSQSGVSDKSSGGGSKNSSGKAFVSPVQDELIHKDDKYAFIDLQDSVWAKDYIDFLVEKNIIAKASDNRFRPDDYITREEFAKIIALAFNISSDENDCTFVDVPEGAWYYNYVSALQKSGIVKGYADSSFGIGKNITREEVCAIIYRASLMNNVFGEAETSNADFADSALISDYAVKAICIMSENGILNGYTDNTFKPTAMITRAESAKIAAEVIKLTEETGNE